jgi:TonB family protein
VVAPVALPAEAAPADAAAPLPTDASVASDKCHGRPTPQLVTALLARGAQAKLCYDLALAKDRTLQGRVQLIVRVEEDGRIERTRVEASAMPLEVDDCVIQVLKTTTYPTPDDGCVEVRIPFSFVPADAGAPAEGGG